VKTYLGVDPGRTGGIAVIEPDGTIRVWPMPAKSERGVDVEAFAEIIRPFASSHVALEWNTARPHEVPDYAFRFGLQTGQLDATMRCHGLKVAHVTPQVWMKQLGLTGKADDPKLYYRMEFIRLHYSYAESLFIGPRGGIQDGPLEALLMAHYLRLITESPFGTKGGRPPPKFRGELAD
jgi:hypothetical protein